ncbi:hypothetical protein GJ496_001119 [Pomphorhynchus laevis]|nr:hypothetical protein GJ496_001115 [Pomphorhynchus laevis]KAI0985145.1 hypothetical protein GJ496_001117 [Pomphorhynchus laevis]KAI0985146.1 hypothetical protein GJ496_001118 [Pomphorhynchus laevis]KAI0985147.1 hypothetical protein GJ496_001119 [Pomphorhynchus laevis]
MQNDAGQYVDMYVPRKCSETNRLITAKDHASIQISIADVDPDTGLITGKSKMFALAGDLRRMGESDDSLVRLCVRDGIIAKNVF